MDAQWIAVILFNWRCIIILMSKQQRSRQQSKRSKNHQKEAWKLPYLESSKQMRLPSQSRSKKHATVHRNFDLNTNYASIPRYSAIDDKNLVYFFDKARNRKLLEDIRRGEIKNNNNKDTKTHREGQYNRSRQVSQVDFLEYIQKMKAKVNGPSLKF